MLLAHLKQLNKFFDRPCIVITNELLENQVKERKNKNNKGIVKQTVLLIKRVFMREQERNKTEVMMDETVHVRCTSEPYMKYNPIFKTAEMEKVTLGKYFVHLGGPPQKHKHELKVHSDDDKAEGLICVKTSFDKACMKLDLQNAELFSFWELALDGDALIH